MKVYNDLTRSKEELIPQTPGEYKIYVCGPTVYELFHLGNARPLIVFDTLRRYLEYCGNRVNYVMNFTDIDDKVIKRAHAEGVDFKELADRMIKEFFIDADGLNVRRATVHPRATETIPEIIEIIQTLYDKGYAYVLDDGVYFDVLKFKDYGKLSRHPLDDLEEGTRALHNEQKHSPLDFVIWKFKKEGEPSWPSPWGEGRPGWHIECSAMNHKFLGDTIDIHGGGQDLIFPHHENEIAQSEAASGKPFVRYWMHNGFINVNNVKMAKSEGNFFRVRDLSTLYPYSVLRFFMLQAHYRMPINFSHELLDGAQNGWNRVITCAENLRFLIKKGEAPAEHGADDEKLSAACTEAREKFHEAMDDDLNTADAFASIFDLVRTANSLSAEAELSVKALKQALDTLCELLDVLGLDPLEEVQTKIPDEIIRLSQERMQAKKEKKFDVADRLRDEIAEKGWRVEDTPQGPKLSKA